MATSILLKFLTLKWNISRTIWRIEVGDGSLFCILYALSFERTLFSGRRFPLSENEAKNLQNGNVHLAQNPDFEIEYLENHLAH